MDFMHDTLYCGKRFRTLNIIDEGVREALAIEVDTSLPALRVIRVLEQLKESYPLPEQIRVDNGPELISSKLVAWCEMNRIRLHHIQPGKPTQNAYIERFNRTMRREVLDAHLFRQPAGSPRNPASLDDLLQRGASTRIARKPTPDDLQTPANQPKQNNQSGLKTLLLKCPIDRDSYK